MEINSYNQSLNAMKEAQSQMNDLAVDVKNATLINKNEQITNISEKTQEVTKNLIDAIVNQIPTQIAYEANAGVIRTQDAVQDTLLNIKA